MRNGPIELAATLEQEGPWYYALLRYSVTHGVTLIGFARESSPSDHIEVALFETAHVCGRVEGGPVHVIVAHNEQKDAIQIESTCGSMQFTCKRATLVRKNEFRIMPLPTEE